MTLGNFKIRDARVEDAASLAGAEREIAKIPRRLASRPEELKDDDFREKILSLSNIATGKYVVVEVDGIIVGHAFLEPLGLAVTAHVVSLTIAIHEGHQGKGFGRLLMTHLIEWTKANPQIEKFELHVRSSNTRAIQLYKSLGFIQEGVKTRRLKYGPNDYLDDVYMALWVGD